jgi:hypothetical protein
MVDLTVKSKCGRTNMEQGYSLPRHVEIARNPEQHRIAQDRLIEELKQDIGYGKRAPKAADS